MSDKIKYKSSKPKKKKKGLTILIIILMIIVGLLLAANMYINSLYVSGEDVPSRYATPEEVNDDIINILICGLDYEEGRQTALTDVIVYATLDTQLNQISAIQIQRDTFMGNDIPGGGKINAVYSAGDEEQMIFNLIDVLNEKLHLPVDHYVTLDMDAFISVVDAIEGGIEMYIPYPIILKDEDGNEEVMFSEPGTYLIDGKMAEAIVRNRNYPGAADTIRAEVQGYFYSAIITYFVEDLGINDFYRIMTRFTNHITTDMDWVRIYSLANFAFTVPYENMTLITPTVHGKLYSTSSGGSISLLDIVPDEWATILNDNFLYYRETPLTAQDLNLGTWNGSILQDYGVVPTNTRTISEMINGAV